MPLLHAADCFTNNEIFIPDASRAFHYPNVYAGDAPVDCNERIGKAALRTGAEILAKRIKLFKEDKNRWNRTVKKAKRIKEPAALLHRKNEKHKKKSRVRDFFFLCCIANSDATAGKSIKSRGFELLKRF